MCFSTCCFWFSFSHSIASFDVIDLVGDGVRRCKAIRRSSRAFASCKMFRIFVCLFILYGGSSKSRCWVNEMSNRRWGNPVMKKHGECTQLDSLYSRFSDLTSIITLFSRNRYSLTVGCKFQIRHIVEIIIINCSNVQGGPTRMPVSIFLITFARIELFG